MTSDVAVGVYGMYGALVVVGVESAGEADCASPLGEAEGAGSSEPGGCEG